MAQYHHAYALDDASYLAAIDRLWDEDPTSRLEDLWSAARQTYRANSGHPAYNDMRIDGAWLEVNGDTGLVGEWLLTLLAPYLTTVNSLSTSLRTGFVAVDEWGKARPQRRWLGDLLVRGGSIRSLYDHSPWRGAIFESKYIEQYCGWLSRTDCARISAELTDLIRERADLSKVAAEMPISNAAVDGLHLALSDADAMIRSATDNDKSVLIGYED